MKKILVVVDMQNDFITGPLGTPEAVSIVDNVVEKIRGEEWNKIYVTMDIHDKSYLLTTEGMKLPVKHCIAGTSGCELNDKIFEVLNDYDYTELCKETFSFPEWTSYIHHDLHYGLRYIRGEDIELTLVGVCTDICMISNALLLKAHYPEMKIVVDASCCAGSTPEKHRMALEVMKSCQVDVVNDESEHDWLIITNFVEKMANHGYIMSSKEIREALAIAEEHPESTPAYLKIMHSEPYNTHLESEG